MDQLQRRNLRGGTKGRKVGNAVRDLFILILGAAVTASLILTYMYTTQPHQPPLRDGTVNRPGWNPIHVFYGSMNHLLDPIPEKWWLAGSAKHKKGSKWFGQHGQDVAVAKVFNFKKGGYFIDLAANDAVWASNTFALEQNFGWNGICIEANPIYWYRLSFRKCRAVGSIVGSRDGEEIQVALGKYKESGPFGGIVGKEFDNKRGGDNAEPRYTAALATILRMFDAPSVIDYLSLDVEGAETFIMKDFAWDEYTFLAMTVERPPEELQSIFQKHGYRKVLDIARGDTLWVHKSIYNQAKKNLAKNPEDIQKHEVKQIVMSLK